MVYFYSIEHLSPRLLSQQQTNLDDLQFIFYTIRYIINQIEDDNVQYLFFRHFVLYHLSSLAKLVLLKILAKKYEFEKEIINCCLLSSNFDFLFQYYELAGIKITGWLEEPENQKCMVRSLGRSTGFNFQSLLFFIKKIKLWSQKDLIHLMADTLHERLDGANNDSNFLFTFSNPLKVIVQIIEILQITIKNEFFHKNMLEKARNKYSQFAQKLITTTIDEDQMYDLLVDWDLEGRKLLYVIYENSMNDLIANEKIQDVIDILWRGNTNTSFSILNFFSVSQNLFNPALQKQNIEQNKTVYPFDKSYQDEDFIARQSVWINQIQFRNLIDQSFIVVFMIAFLVYLLQSFSIFTEGFFPINQSIDVVEHTIEKYQLNMSEWIIINIFIGINLPLNAIVNLVYLREFERNAIFNAGQILDLLFAASINLYTIFVYTMHLYSYEDIQILMTILLNVLTFFCYIRLILCLTITKDFGIIIQALGVIFIEVAKFFKPFLAITLLFTFVGFIIFNQLQTGQFKTFLDGLLFLIEAMFGQFQFSDFSEQYPISGIIFMLLHLYALAVIFMNVLVAILAFNFEKTNRQARILHYQHIIFFVRQGNYLQKHGCLIVVPIILEFILIPYLILKKFFAYNSEFMKKLQNWIIQIAYSPILLIIIILTVSLNLLLFPFAYVQRILTIFRLFYNRKVKISKIFQWIIFGIFILLRRIFYYDIKELISYLLSKQSQEEKANQIQKKITFDPTIRYIFKTICRLYIQGTTHCTINELFTYIKEDMLNPCRVPMETCVDDESIVGVKLLKKYEQGNIESIMQFSSPNLFRQRSLKRNSTPRVQGLQKQSSRSSMQKIDKINVKRTFQGIPEMEDDCELIYEYFERFCFRDISREDEQRDSVLNLRNILRLHEHYDISELNVVVHFQLYKAIKQL